TAGDWSPTAPTTNTRVAAMLYAGATDAVAMTVVEISPRAPDLSPLSSCCSCVSTGCSAVAMSHPPGFGPVRPGPSIPGRQAAAGLLRQHRCDVLMNATDPRFVMPLFRAALQAGTHYLDMAMSLSYPHPEEPYRRTGVKLGDEQFALAPEWERSGRLALVGMGVEPGLSDVFARYAADELFGEITELGVRDGANLEVAGYEFAPTFSIWTTIEECLNPPVIWERDRGWFTTEPFSEPEVFTFPAGIGPVECVNVEHEEVLLMPRWVEARRVTFKYGLGAEFIGGLRTLHTLGLDRTDPVTVRSAAGPVAVSPRAVAAACL